jgi:DNA-binding winged helix-turn-helix (wHTH) protein/TolB-like protein
MNRPERYAFGDFVLERSQQRVLRGDGTELSMTPRVFSALLLFVEHPAELLDKDTLMRTLWPGVVVEENNLSQVVSNLRRALGDDAKVERWIQTVPRRGFRFLAAVTILEDAGGPVHSAPAPTAALALSTHPVVAPEVAAPHAGVGRRRWLWIAAAGVVGLAAFGAAWLARRPGAAYDGAKRLTLAVLPFKPLVMEGRDELLEVGMADSLIARLSTIGGLVVRSVGSVRRYAGPDQDLARAARELDVAWIVDGSLQRRGEQLHVTARLLSVADGTAAWSGSFDERVTGIFDVQDAISEKIARVLAPSLAADRSTGTRAALDGVGGTRNGDAYQLYLAARLHAQGIRADGLRKSAALYNQAIEVDPRYALAYAGLVETYRRMLFGADVVPADAFTPATVAARRALELAPGLAEAHAGLGWIRFWYEFDWVDAERIFRRAIELNPNVVEAHFGLGLLLLSLDRPVERSTRPSAWRAKRAGSRPCTGAWSGQGQPPNWVRW